MSRLVIELKICPWGTQQTHRSQAPSGGDSGIGKRRCGRTNLDSGANRRQTGSWP